MGIGHVVGNVLPHILLQSRDVDQEARSHRDQGLTGPSVEPIKGSAVHQGWELTGPDTELVSDWTEAEHHMEVAANLGNNFSTFQYQQYWMDGSIYYRSIDNFLPRTVICLF